MHKSDVISTKKILSDSTNRSINKNIMVKRVMYFESTLKVVKFNYECF